MFDEMSLLSISNSIGRPIRVYPRNVHRSILNSARICVELDVSKPFLESICISFEDDLTKKILVGFWVKVYYDVVPPFCSYCSHIGHNSEGCKRRLEEILEVGKVDPNKESGRISQVGQLLMNKESNIGAGIDQVNNRAVENLEEQHGSNMGSVKEMKQIMTVCNSSVQLGQLHNVAETVEQVVVQPVQRGFIEQRGFKEGNAEMAHLDFGGMIEGRKISQNSNENTKGKLDATVVQLQSLGADIRQLQGGKVGSVNMEGQNARQWGGEDGLDNHNRQNSDKEDVVQVLDSKGGRNNALFDNKTLKQPLDCNRTSIVSELDLEALEFDSKDDREAMTEWGQIEKGNNQLGFCIAKEDYVAGQPVINGLNEGHVANTLILDNELALVKGDKKQITFKSQALEQVVQNDRTPKLNQEKGNKQNMVLIEGNNGDQLGIYKVAKDKWTG